MEQQRLLKLIENKGTSSKEETTELWDIVRTFPYFQTARLLLVKSFHKQSSIHFHAELKSASAYASDRKVLFHLINDDAKEKQGEEESNVFVIEPKPSVKEEPVLKLSENYTENQFAPSLDSAKEETYIEKPPPKEAKANNIIPEPKYKEEEIIEEKENAFQPSSSNVDDVSTAPEDIIRKRLNEILSRNKPAPQREEAAPNETLASNEEPAKKVESEIIPPSGGRGALDELPAIPADEIEGLEIETIIEENYLQELEKLPVIEPPSPQREEVALNGESAKETASVLHPPQADRGADLSFIEWLKQKSLNKTTIEEVTDESYHFSHENESSELTPRSGGRGASELINKFIETAPRITPVKAEFYSPSNMAKQSIIDNEAIISETLAGIYFKQGNYEKARSYYERLSLLYPEKSASFAPLLKEIDNILNQIKD